MNKQKPIYGNIVCKLRRHVTTEEYDFIPKGTPVILLGWDPDKKNRILARAAVYLYESYVHEDELKEPRAHVNSGLIISVKPDNLVFDDKGSRVNED